MKGVVSKVPFGLVTVLVSIIYSVKTGSKMVDEEVFWPAIFLAVLDGFLLGIAKWGSLVT